MAVDLKKKWETQSVAPGTQQDQQQPVSGPQSVSGPGSAMAGTSAGAGAAPVTPVASPSQGSGRFVNVQKYLQSNVGAGGKIGQQVQQKTGLQSKEAQAQQGDVLGIKAKAEEQYNKIIEDTGTAETGIKSATDSSSTGDTSGITAVTDTSGDFLSSLASGEYGEDLIALGDQATTELGELATSLYDLGGTTRNLQSEQGRQSLLRDIYGRMGGYGSGISSLGNLFFQSGDEGKALQEAKDYAFTQFDPLKSSYEELSGEKLYSDDSWYKAINKPKTTAPEGTRQSISTAVADLPSTPPEGYLTAPPGALDEAYKPRQQGPDNLPGPAKTAKTPTPAPEETTQPPAEEAATEEVTTEATGPKSIYDILEAAGDKRSEARTLFFGDVDSEEGGLVDKLQESYKEYITPILEARAKAEQEKRDRVAEGLQVLQSGGTLSDAGQLREVLDYLGLDFNDTLYGLDFNTLTLPNMPVEDVVANQMLADQEFEAMNALASLSGADPLEREQMSVVDWSNQLKNNREFNEKRQAAMEQTIKDALFSSKQNLGAGVTSYKDYGKFLKEAGDTIPGIAYDKGIDSSWLFDTKLRNYDFVDDKKLQSLLNSGMRIEDAMNEAFQWDSSMLDAYKDRFGMGEDEDGNPVDYFQNMKDTADAYAAYVKKKLLKQYKKQLQDKGMYSNLLNKYWQPQREEDTVSNTNANPTMPWEVK